jgi:hypothetical protein
VLLRGLDAKVQDNEAVFDALRGRLSPLIGNLEAVHEGLANGEVIARELEGTPWLEALVHCWTSESASVDEDSVRMYELVDHCPAR